MNLNFQNFLGTFFGQNRGCILIENDPDKITQRKQSG